MAELTRFPLTSRTKASLAIAREIAAAFGHDDVSGLHVALGLFREGENPAVAVLDLLGVELRKLGADLEASLPPRGHGVSAEAVPSSSSEEEAILRAAESQSELLGTNYVATEHVLLGLVQDEDAPVGRLLRAHSVTRDNVLAGVKRIVTGTLEDLERDIHAEFRRICGDDNARTWSEIKVPSTVRLLAELRRVQDGAGPRAVLGAIYTASQPRSGV